MRASASTGFRAPSLQQQFYAAQATNNVNGVLLDTVTLPVDNPVAIALGATPLDAEQSMSFSAGIVVSAIRNLNVTIDAYRVDIDDRIVVTDNLTATRDALGNPCFALRQPAVIPRVARSRRSSTPQASRQSTPRASSSTASIPAPRVSISWRPTGCPISPGGRLNLTGGFNYNKTKIRKLAGGAGSAREHSRPDTVRAPGIASPDAKGNRATRSISRPTSTATGSEPRCGQRATARCLLPAPTNSATSTSTPRRSPTSNCRANPFGYQVTFALGANNLFDIYPTNTPARPGHRPGDRRSSANYPATNYVAPFSSFSPFGFNGRFLYGRVGVTF